jgi:hypothetical protein
MESGKLQHYIPATHLGSFSRETGQPRRDRMLAAADLQKGSLFSARASSLGAKNDFYTLAESPLIATPGHHDFVDKAFSFYEPRLAEAIDRLVAGNIDIKTWAGTLVPFVAALLARGPDFADRFERRLEYLGLASYTAECPDNTNLARLMELQRLLAPILVACWRVIRMQGRGELIVSDTGYVPFQNPELMETGIAIPLNRRAALLVTARLRRTVAIRTGGCWRPNILYDVLNSGMHLSLNKAIACSAHRFIFGPDAEIVSRYYIPQTRGYRPDPGRLGFISGRAAAPYEFVWHRFLTIIETLSTTADLPLSFPFSWHRNSIRVNLADS